jgi:protein-tyrosine phosphatase
MPREGTVLFVCHGNICRSPYAAAAARRLLPPTVRVGSAGFVGPDRPSPPEAVAVAGERGIDLAPHRSQVIQMEHLREVDLVVVMDALQRHRLVNSRPELRGRVVLLGDLDPRPVTRRTIPDPVEQPAEVFRACYDRIDRCVGALAGSWGTAGGEDAEDQSGKLE